MTLGHSPLADSWQDVACYEILSARADIQYTELTAGTGKHMILDPCMIVDSVQGHSVGERQWTASYMLG